jgi:hypothetical protein
VNVDQLAEDEPSPELVRHMQAWRNKYPWLQLAFQECGRGARAVSDGWRVRIEDELKATLDFKARPDGTAALWCGMSVYDFHHDPTPNELFEGLADAYRRERERRRQRPSDPQGHRQDERRRAPPKALAPLVRALPPAAEESLARLLEAIFLPRVADLALIFLAVTALTFMLAALAIAVG